MTRRRVNSEGDQSHAPAGARSSRVSPASPGPALDHTLHIGDLVPDPQNRRKHNPRNIGLIVDALHSVGAGRSIVIDEDDVVLAGNGAVEAAAEAGIERVRVVEASGHELVAVRRRGLTDEQKRQLAMFDNRTAELATWDLAQLAADADAGLDLSSFFTNVELADLLSSDAPVPEFPAVDESAQGQLDALKGVTCPQCGHTFREGA